jgi:DNA polymerase
MHYALIMHHIILDFETFYDADYSLRKMTMREYIMHRRFAATLLSVKEGVDGQTTVLVGPEIADWVSSRNWDDTCMIAHNAMFDAAILAWRFGVVPARIRCTMFMANCTVAHQIGSASLARLAEHFQLGDKDTAALARMEGVDPLFLDRESDLWKDYVAYAGADADKCAALVKLLAWRIPTKHHIAMSATLRAYVVGGLEMDADLLLQSREEATREMEAKLAAVGATREDLRSAPRMAELLRGLGVDPPMKLSFRTNEMTYAFSKRDVEFVKLKEHPDPRVAMLVEARLGAMSSIEETRAATMLRLCELKGGPLLHVPLIYAGAHTGRFAGADGLNMQNLPRRNKKSLLRKAIVAPRGYTVLSVDAAQIEARILAWLAGCTHLVDAFAKGEDVYAQFASKVFGRTVTKASDPEARDLGKIGVLSLGYQTGADTLWQTLFLGGADVDHAFAAKMVETYRNSYQEIRGLWQALDDAIRYMIAGQNLRIGPVEFFAGGWRVLEHNEQERGKRAEFEVRYPDLQEHVEQSAYGYKTAYRYWRHRYGTWANLYGGALTENIVQHLAWQQIVDAIVRMEVDHEAVKRDWRFVLQVHDELVYVVPERDADEALAALIDAMCRQPAWARWKSYPVPLKAEGSYGRSYGDAK